MLPASVKRVGRHSNYRVAFEDVVYFDPLLTVKDSLPCLAEIIDLRSALPTVLRRDGKPCFYHVANFINVCASLLGPFQGMRINLNIHDSI